MKKFISVLLIIVLALSMVACGKEENKEETPIVNPTNLTFSLIDGDDEIKMEGFEEIKGDAFIAEEGSTVLEATQLYCMSHDISISVDSSKNYITEIAGFSEGDYDAQTGWVFTINGEMGNLPANEEIIEEGDEIAWEFIDFSSMSW